AGIEGCIVGIAVDDALLDLGQGAIRRATAGVAMDSGPIFPAGPVESRVLRRTVALLHYQDAADQTYQLVLIFDEFVQALPYMSSLGVRGRGQNACQKEGDECFNDGHGSLLRNGSRRSA